jgi:hypothetical protein
MRTWTPLARIGALKRASSLRSDRQQIAFLLESAQIYSDNEQIHVRQASPDSGA